MWCDRCRSYTCICNQSYPIINCKECNCDPCSCCPSCQCCCTCTCSGSYAKPLCNCTDCSCFLNTFINTVKDKCHEVEHIISDYDVVSRQLDQREDLLDFMCMDLIRRLNEIRCIFTGVSFGEEEFSELISSIKSFYKGDRSNFFFCLSHCPKLIIFVIRHDNGITISLVSKMGIQKLAAEGDSGAKKKPIGFKKLPKGWTAKSFKKFYKTITSDDPDHPFSACVAKLKDKFDDPKRFCSKMLDTSFGTTKWRNKKIREQLEKKMGIFNPNAGPPKHPVA